MLKRTPAIALLCCTALAISACSRKAPDTLPPAPIGSGTGTGAGTGAGAIIPGSQEDFLRSVMADRVFFGFDLFNIDAEAARVLQSQSEWLRRNPAVRILIEGHTDERGTRDYNLALGERRATAAKNYLISLGIDAGRIETISYGKERPAALGSGEGAWAQNRRAVSVVVIR